MLEFCVLFRKIASGLAMIHKAVMLSSYYDHLRSIQLFSLYTSRTGGHFLIFVFNEDSDTRKPAESGNFQWVTAPSRYSTQQPGP